MTRTDVLKSLKNDIIKRYKIVHFVPEVTFEGDDKKPDFGEIVITYVPRDKLIELKSLKIYFYQFREKMFSYERFINIVYDDIKEIYDPYCLTVTLKTNPRGGISSFLEVSSKYA